MPKQYKTARGMTVDLSQILAENETVRSVGNMNVNARGDAIDSKNKIVETRNKRVKKQYGKQHKQSLVNEAVPTSKRHAKSMQTVEDVAKQYAEIENNVPAQVAASETAVEQLRSEPEPVQAPSKGGLAAAIAKARESKQELMKTERQRAREDEGVKRI